MIRVDLSEILKAKKPNLYRRIPRFLIRWMEALICQKSVNRVLEFGSDKEGVSFITTSLDYLTIKRTSEGLDRLDKEGRYLFASNHPLGGLDGFSLAEQISAYFGDVKLVVNDILMNLTPVASVFIPINKHGRQNSNYAQRLNKELDTNIPIIYFPAGLCSRLIKGEIKDLPWHKSFVQKAIDSKRDIVPTFVNDRNSRFFYYLGALRKRFGIKLNIEMLLLPSELFKKEGKGNIAIYYGEPITHERLMSDERSTKEWVEYIREACYRLKPEQK